MGWHFLCRKMGKGIVKKAPLLLEKRKEIPTEQQAALAKRKETMAQKFVRKETKLAKRQKRWGSGPVFCFFVIIMEVLSLQ